VAKSSAPGPVQLGDGPPLISKAELARHLRRSQRSIDRLRALGLLPPPVPLPGLKRFWSRDAINAWLSSLQKARP
jgi:hypothetical protein